ARGPPAEACRPPGGGGSVKPRTLELPRGGVCRNPHAPGVNEAFWPHRGGKHHTPPKIDRPVRSTTMTARQPIPHPLRTIVPGHCWLRRERQGVRVLAGGAGAAPVIRAKLVSGTLPAMAPTKVWGSVAGDGSPCAGCGESLNGGTEYEVEFADTVSVRFH